MKNYLLLIGIVACFTQCEMTDTNKQNVDRKEQMTERSFAGRSVVFYNVENLFDTEDDPHTNDSDFTPYGDYNWDEERYQTKLDRISEAIDLVKEKPVLIGLAEVENHKVLEDLLNNGPLSQTTYKYIHYNSPDQRGIDCALLYDSRLFTVEKSEKIPVKLPNNLHFNTRDILYVKGTLSGTVETHIFVNHWSSRREGQIETEHKRLRAAEILRAKVDEILNQDKNANIIILGDFNDHPTNKSLRTVLRAKESGYSSEGDLINLLYEEHEEGEGTSVHQREWAVLDQIIVSQSVYDNSSKLGIVDRDAEILREDDLLYTYHDGGQKPNATFGGRKYYGGYSDHLPVYIVLK